MEGLRVVGNPVELAKRYAQDADSIFYTDTVASLYGRNQLTELLERTTDDIFIPITVAGGIKCRADVKRLLDAGADEVAINTAAIRNPRLVQELSDACGAQAITISIEAKRTSDGRWECYTDNGRERSGLDAVRWAQEAVALGAGQILLTSIDQDGTRRGFDVALWKAIAPLVSVPVIICGGMGKLEDLNPVRGAHGISMATVLHYGKLTIAQMRAALGQDVRQPAPHFIAPGARAP